MFTPDLIMLKVVNIVLLDLFRRIIIVDEEYRLKDIAKKISGQSCGGMGGK